MQKNNMSFLKNLTTVADARTARASSWIRVEEIKITGL